MLIENLRPPPNPKESREDDQRTCQEGKITRGPVTSAKARGPSQALESRTHHYVKGEQM